MKIWTDDDILERGRRVMEIEATEIQRVSQRLDARFAAASRLISETVHEGGKILLLGVGKSGNIGEKIAATFASVGVVAGVLNATNALHGDLGVVENGDLIIALSSSGETEELLRTVSVLKRFEVRIVALTGRPESSLGRLSDATIDVSVNQEACPLNLAPTSSTTAMLAVGDALAMVLLEARGVRRDDFARNHPGGAIGKALLTPVTELLRKKGTFASVLPETSVRKVIGEMASHRSGAAVVVAADGKLVGIFTHGDFVRRFNENPAVVDRPVAEVMTDSPLTVADTAFAVELLDLLRDHHVDELIVVDNDHRVVGLVDVQDLSRHQLL